jgi:hypothetical protein
MILDPISEAADGVRRSRPEHDRFDQRGQSRRRTVQALQVDVHSTVPDDLVIKSATSSPDADRPRRPEHHGRRRSLCSKVPWDQIRLVGVVNTFRGI